MRRPPTGPNPALRRWPLAPAPAPAQAAGRTFGDPRGRQRKSAAGKGAGSFAPEARGRPAATDPGRLAPAPAARPGDPEAGGEAARWATQPSRSPPRPRAGARVRSARSAGTAAPPAGHSRQRGRGLGRGAAGPRRAEPPNLPAPRRNDVPPAWPPPPPGLLSCDLGRGPGRCRLAGVPHPVSGTAPAKALRAPEKAQRGQLVIGSNC